jgi:hypothetical protein
MVNGYSKEEYIIKNIKSTEMLPRKDWRKQQNATKDNPHNRDIGGKS